MDLLSSVKKGTKQYLLRVRVPGSRGRVSLFSLRLM